MAIGDNINADSTNDKQILNWNASTKSFTQLFGYLRTP